MISHYISLTQSLRIRPVDVDVYFSRDVVNWCCYSSGCCSRSPRPSNPSLDYGQHQLEIEVSNRSRWHSVSIWGVSLGTYLKVIGYIFESCPSNCSRRAIACGGVWVHRAAAIRDSQLERRGESCPALQTQRCELADYSVEARRQDQHTVEIRCQSHLASAVSIKSGYMQYEKTRTCDLSPGTFYHVIASIPLHCDSAITISN